MIDLLIVDDSIVIQNILIKAFARDGTIRVVKTAKNGQEAFDCLATQRPDVMVVDIEMPVMDGLTLVRKIMQSHPLPIVIFASQTPSGALKTFEALDAGALDYVAKKDPSDPLQKQQIDLLIQKIKSCAQKDTQFLHHYLAMGQRHPMLSFYQLIIIGASTGGPKAICEIILNLPPNFPLPIVVIQHMPSGFSQIYAERLNQQASLKVTELQGEEKLTPSCVYIVPGGKQVSFEKSSDLPVAVLKSSDKTWSYNPSLDYGLLSALTHIKGKFLTLVLTGMGNDGLKAAEALYHKNYPVWVQDEKSSIVWGMPGVIVHAGYAHLILPLEAIAGALIKEVLL